jgi:hypothetical protein
LGSFFGGSSGHGPSGDGWGSIFIAVGPEERDIDVFEKSLGGDPSYASGELDQVVAGLAGLFAAEGVGEDEGFGELTGSHQETGAVNGPLTFDVHSAFFHWPAGPTLFSGFGD